MDEARERNVKSLSSLSSFHSLSLSFSFQLNPARGATPSPAWTEVRDNTNPVNKRKKKKYGFMSLFSHHDGQSMLVKGKKKFFFYSRTFYRRESRFPLYLPKRRRRSIVERKNLKKNTLIELVVDSLSLPSTACCYWCWRKKAGRERVLCCACVHSAMRSRRVATPFRIDSRYCPHVPSLSLSLPFLFLLWLAL